MKKIFILLALFIFTSAFSQIDKVPGAGIGGKDIRITPIGKKDKNNENDSIKSTVKIYPITNYKIFNVNNDTIIVDTILQIQHRYDMNYILKDNFLKIPFQNMGQTFNSLSFENTNNSLLPNFVALAKNYNYLKHNNVHFYNVPTPYSDIIYKNGLGDGQFLKALITSNINKKINLSFGYKGITSLGLYKNSVAEIGRFFSTLNYNSNNNKYRLKMYFVSHDISNDENGGIKIIQQFENSGDVYKDRSRIDVNYTNASNMLKGKRYYAGNEYKLFSTKDLYLINNTKYHHQSYVFNQTMPTEIIGKFEENEVVKDSVFLKRFENFSGVRFSKKNILIQTGVNFIYQKYSFEIAKIINHKYIPKYLIHNDLVLTSNLKFTWKKIFFDADLDFSLTPNMQGYYFKVATKYSINKSLQLKAALKSYSKTPDFRFVLYQSAYNKYNWYNKNLKNEFTQEIAGSISHNKWGNLKAKQILVNNYHYFGLDSLPNEYTGTMGISSIQYSNNFKYKKIGLRTDILFQKVINADNVLSLPTYVTRATFYFNDYYYHRNLFVQAGATLKYFDSFYANSYNPLLADFNAQNTQKIGNYPLVDVFVNFKVKRFRFFANLEHVNALLEYKNPKYYTAPLQPYRDFSVRLGLRWIFFN
jgi:hypothetical protein